MSQKKSPVSKLTLWKLSNGLFLTGDPTPAMGIITEMKNRGLMSFGKLPLKLGSHREGWTLAKKVDLLENALKTCCINFMTVKRDSKGRLRDKCYGVVFEETPQGVAAHRMIDYDSDALIKLDRDHTKVKNFFGW